jgi:hypothetical protein
MKWCIENLKKCMNVELESAAWLVTPNFKVEPAQKNPIDLEQVKEKLKLRIHCYFTTGPCNTGLFTIILPVDRSYMKIYLYVVNPVKVLNIHRSVLIFFLPNGNLRTRNAWCPSSPAEPESVVQVGGSTSKPDDDHRLEQIKVKKKGKNK